VTSGDLEGAESAPPSPPPFGRRNDAVTVLLITDNGTVLWRCLNFDHSTVKHALQNTHYTSGFLTALECTKFVFGRGFAPDSTGELTAFP